MCTKIVSTREKGRDDVPLTIMSEKRSVTNEKRVLYRKANKTEKGRIIDELISLCGYNRSYAARLLRQPVKTRAEQRVIKTFHKTKRTKTKVWSGVSGSVKEDLADNGTWLPVKSPDCNE